MLILSCSTADTLNISAQSSILHDSIWQLLDVTLSFIGFKLHFFYSMCIHTHKENTLGFEVSLFGLPKFTNIGCCCCSFFCFPIEKCLHAFSGTYNNTQGNMAVEP